MPIITVQLSAGYTAAQKKSLLEQSTHAVVNSLQPPLANVRIFLQESNINETIVAGKIGVGLLTFIVYLIEGRTETQKVSLVQALNQSGCASIGVSAQDIRTIIHDVPKTDMGVAGGLTAKHAGR